MPGKVMKAGGSSLGVTIRIDIVTRFNLKPDYALKVDIELIRKGKTK